MESRCIRFHEFGTPHDVLKIEKKSLESPGHGEVLVRMITRPINPSDLIPITGAYSHRISLPCIPGYEGVGIVEDAGPGVSHDLIGKRVLPLRGEGTWQEFVKASADLVVPVPDCIDDYTAAQLYINPLTAWVTSTEILQVKPGNVVVVNAGGSSIGRIYAQLSRILGFRLIAVTRNDEYTNELLQLGAIYVINSSNEPVQKTVMEVTNGLGAHAAIDSVGGISGTDLAFSIRAGGTFLTIGLLSGTPVSWSEITQRTKVNVRMFHLRHWNQQASVHTWQEKFKHLLSLLNSNHLRLMAPVAEFGLSEVHEAVRTVSLGGTKGKVFLGS